MSVTRMLWTTARLQRTIKLVVCGLLVLLGLILLNVIHLPSSSCDPDLVCPPSRRSPAADDEKRPTADGRIAREKSRHAFLVVLILSGPKNKPQRDAIRETWLSESSHTESILHFFVVGAKGLKVEEMKSLSFEHATHDDVLFLDNFQDSYYNLSDKVVLGFEWLDANVDYHYVFKGDDDTFVRLGLLMKELRTQPKERLYWGFFDGRARVKRKGKWIEKDWILCDRYLPHALGGGYILSRDLVHYIVTNSALLKRYISEDVTVGTWLGPLDINRVHDPRFDTEWRSRGCSNRYIVTHKQSTEMLRAKWRNLKTKGALCTQEHQEVLSYEYRWDLPPTKCCLRENPNVP